MACEGDNCRWPAISFCRTCGLFLCHRCTQASHSRPACFPQELKSFTKEDMLGSIEHFKGLLSGNFLAEQEWIGRAALKAQLDVDNNAGKLVEFVNESFQQITAAVSKRWSEHLSRIQRLKVEEKLKIQQTKDAQLYRLDAVVEHLDLLKKRVEDTFSADDVVEILSEKKTLEETVSKSSLSLRTVSPAAHLAVFTEAHMGKVKSLLSRCGEIFSVSSCQPVVMLERLQVTPEKRVGTPTEPQQPSQAGNQNSVKRKLPSKQKYPQKPKWNRVKLGADKDAKSSLTATPIPTVEAIGDGSGPNGPETSQSPNEPLQQRGHFPCAKCPRVYQFLCLRNNHVKAVHMGMVKHKCKRCGKNCFNSAQLALHQNFCSLRK